MRNKKVTIFSLVVLLSLIMSLVFPTGVLADDNPPPSPETPEVVTPPEGDSAGNVPADVVVPESSPAEQPVVTEDVVPAEAATSQEPATTDVAVSDAPDEVATQEAPADTGSTADDTSLLSQIPEGTDVVVLDESDEVVPLASQEAAEFIELVDPLWCPGNAGPDNGGCRSFLTPQDLINDMDATNPATTTPLTPYESNGTIYFTANPGGSFTLLRGNNSNAIDNADYNILRMFNLTLVGGWNGDTSNPFIDPNNPTNFGTNTITIGGNSNDNRWVGNITLSNFNFSNVSSTNAITVYTTGSITLDNIEVLDQTNNTNTASLTSTSGNITVQNSSFDGDNVGNKGFSASTGGSISISDTTFQQAYRSGSESYDGATLTSTNITLTNVTAQNNEGDGIYIGGGATIVKVTGGSFINNGWYGILFKNTGSTFYVKTSSPVTCTGNNPSCSNETMVYDNDFDGIQDGTDLDDDSDGVADTVDAFPLDPNESVDIDHDGIGNNTDLDDDGDGVADTVDAFPLDPNESVDTDHDGIGNNADLDDDGDGVADTVDAFPLDPNESVDTDHDGIGNNTDLDDDGDGVADTVDAFPLDPNEFVDTDHDGIGNNTDLDDDGDGVADTVDAFPLDPNESVDTDYDGIGNNADLDDDNDGVSDLTEIANGTDPLFADTDTDGIGDNADNCALVSNADQADADSDGQGDACDTTPNGDTNGQPGDNSGNPIVSNESVNQTNLLIPVTGGQGTDLSCTVSTMLEKAGFQVSFANLCGHSVELTEALEGNLSRALPDGHKIIGGVDIVLLQNGSSVDTLPADASITLSFKLPSSVNGENLAILFWDPTANGGAGDWVEKSVTVVDGKATLTINMPGTFVLVDKSPAAAMQGQSPTAVALNNLYSSLVNFFKQFSLQ